MGTTSFRNETAGSACRTLPARIRTRTKPASRFIGSDQFPHHAELFFDEVTRTSAEIIDGRRFYIDAEMMIERGEDFLEIDGPLNRFATEPIGRADYPPVAHPA